METFVELMKRLVEIQRDEQRSQALIAEDKRLLDGLQQRILTGRPPQSVKFSQDRSERA
jgi:hypothetical protein